MTTLTEIRDEVMSTHHNMLSRLDLIEREQKTLGDKVAGNGGGVPAEYKSAMASLNVRIDEQMVLLNELLTAQKEAELRAKRPGFNVGNGNSKSNLFPGTKAFLKAMRCYKHQPNLLTNDELQYVSYQHLPAEEKALYAGEATTGGFFATSDFRDQLQEYQILISPVRARAQVTSTSSEKVLYPSLVTDTTAFFAVEQQSYQTSTDPNMQLLDIPVHEMRGLLQVSQQNLEDSVFNLQDFLMRRLSMKFGQRESTAFVLGNGLGQPRGFMTYPMQSYQATGVNAGKLTGLNYIPYVFTGAASTLGPDVLITALHDLKAYYRPNATWGFTTTTLGALRLLKDSQNRPLWQPFAAGGLPATIYDRPYIEFPDMDEIGANKFPIIIGDFSNYLIVDRVGLSMRQLDELFATSGLIGFIARKRVGGDVLLPEAFRTVKIATS